ncbi:MAG: tRNA (adenosine(37)-N6)-threonylcarbamoyltransferase complex ATPase subunit type 1 TsaE [Parcubacteria group bacterium]|nr:tRNA (adenosine(37)-N6)-threonylcarbamoyltransferase complex ATPase subunit type 1 TsaE [Parcubacteria group bacterium]
MKLKILSKSRQETQDIALNLAKSINDGKVIAFEGNLGSGKTTFIQGLASGLSIKENISSPTFVIFKKYSIPNHKKIKLLYHFDLYRIGSLQEIIDLGFEEIINDKSALVVIEWAEKIKKLLPKSSLNIKIKYVSKNSRKIIVSG